MSQSSANVMSNEAPSTQSPKPWLWDNLPNYPVSVRGCSSRTAQEIDLLLLALEALELGSSEQMLATAKNLNLTDLIPNRVALWRLRCTNPWRRSYLRRYLELEPAKALTIIAANRSRQLTFLIRQLLLVEQQLREKDLPLQQNFRLNWYLERFRTHFRSRMNPRRARIAEYLASLDQLDELALSLLRKLLFATGSAGTQRLWCSLFDGEVR
ncbi:DUF3038 domain-containing protein [Dactylococcopsis salina]|uniref:DUF3038 domain-containing protein n=2 Tax=Dactylococcopsis salina TaxID=292566 RepID=K9YRC3_DACS8|nr:Protein of unknown function (DUF3038) [Dactylococcopsis salina PCC 8305]